VLKQPPRRRSKEFPLRTQGRPYKKDKAADQQCLSPRQETALVDYILRMSECGHPLPVKFLCSLALVIACGVLLRPSSISLDELSYLMYESSPERRESIP
jgi:hypothetical protein